MPIDSFSGSFFKNDAIGETFLTFQFSHNSHFARVWQTLRQIEKYMTLINLLFVISRRCWRVESNLRKLYSFGKLISEKFIRARVWTRYIFQYSSWKPLLPPPFFGWNYSTSHFFEWRFISEKTSDSARLIKRPPSRIKRFEILVSLALRNSY